MLRTDRLLGVDSGLAVKAPVRVASNGNLLLTGLSTVNGVALAEGDRVLAKDQANPIQNGIYDATSGSWTRSRDFDGTRDVVQGTIVVSGPDASIFYRLTTASPDIGVSALAFTAIGASMTRDAIAAALYPQNTPEVSASVTPSLFYINRYKDVPVERYGVSVAGDPDLNTAGMNRAFAVAAAIANTGGVIILPQGTIPVRAAQLGFDANGFGLNAINIQGSGKGQTFLEAHGATTDQPILNWSGGDNDHRIDSIFLRDFALSSDNGLARGITANWVIHSKWEHLYFYNLYNGWVGAGCFDADFYKTNSFAIARSNFLLHGDCNAVQFYGCRMCGNTGVLIDESANCVNLYGCDIEGIVPVGGVAGAGVRIALLTGATFDGLLIDGTHFEHINGYAVDINPADADSVHGVVWRGGIAHGGFVAPESNTFATYAARLRNLKGFEISAIELTDWGTAAFNINGSESNGRVEFNTSRGLVAALSSQAFATSVRVANNFSGPSYEYSPTNEYAPLYGATVAIDRNLGEIQNINVANGSAFSISAPTNTANRLTIRIRNVSGGAMGAITWNAIFKMASWTNPANGQSRAITFDWNGSAWVEFSRNTADVPN